MLDFVLSALRVLVEIPHFGVSDDENAIPSIMLDADGLAEKYAALTEEERACLAEEWGLVQQLFASQNQVHEVASNLALKLTVRGIHRKMQERGHEFATDRLLQDDGLKCRLHALIDELPHDPSAVLLEIAKTLHRKEGCAGDEGRMLQ